MKHTKQILALLLAVVLCIGLLAGCAKTETKPETDTSADTTTPESPEAPDATETPAAEANAPISMIVSCRDERPVVSRSKATYSSSNEKSPSPWTAMRSSTSLT